MSRRRVWDTDNPEKLRHAINTGDDFRADDYKSAFIPITAMYDPGAIGVATFNSIWPAMSMPAATDEIVHGAFMWPTYWRRGRVAVRVVGRTNNVAASQVVRWSVQVQTSQPDVPNYVTVFNEDWDQTLNTGGSTQPDDAYKLASTIIEIPSDNVFAGVAVSRLGSHANDNFAGLYKLVGVEIEWNDTPVRV